VLQMNVFFVKGNVHKRCLHEGRKGELGRMHKSAIKGNGLNVCGRPKHSGIKLLAECCWMQLLSLLHVN